MCAETDVELRRVVQVRRVTAQDWPALRALRLEALRDTPIGYLELAADAERLPQQDWRARALRGSTQGDSCQVMAFDGDRPVGNAVAFLRGGAGWLAAVYLAPGCRGRGLLARLVEPLAAWCRQQGAAELRLQVHEDNLRAQRAYAKLGFAPTGKRQPYALDPTRDELEMAQRL